MEDASGMNSRPERSAAFARAEEHLRSLLSTVNAEAGPARLPTIAALAQAAGVSKTTMAKAVSLLVRDGVLHASQGAGIRVLGPPGPRPLPARGAERQAPSRAWQRVREAIAADILAGRFAPGGALPSVKELCRSYGVCHQTLKRAAAGIDGLVPYKRSYRLEAARQSAHGGRVVFVAATDSIEALAFDTSRSPEFWQCLERECHNHRVGLDIRSVHSVLDNQAGQPARPAGPVLGYIVSPHNLDGALVLEVLDVLGRRKRPIAVTHEFGDFLRLVPSVNNPMVRTFSIANDYRAGRDVGSYLLRLGHRGVACFSRSPDVAWSENRVAGLRDAFSRAGVPDGVRVFTAGISDIWVQMFPDHPGAQPRGEQSRAIIRQAQRMMDCVPASDQENLGDLTMRIRIALLLNEEGKRLAPLFESALAEPGITAWVAVFDRMALMAQAFLRQRNRPAGKHISVVGFDDIVESFAKGLSSYNFNVRALASALVQHVLGGSRMGRTRGDDVTFIPGFVVERGSTGRAVK